jgi:hypothetical protein
MPASRLLLAACVAVMLEGACLGLCDRDWPGRGAERRGGVGSSEGLVA